MEGRVGIERGIRGRKGHGRGVSGWGRGVSIPGRGSGIVSDLPSQA